MIVAKLMPLVIYPIGGMTISLTSAVVICPKAPLITDTDREIDDVAPRDKFFELADQTQRFFHGCPAQFLPVPDGDSYPLLSGTANLDKR